jgi:hypothetical protein
MDEISYSRCSYAEAFPEINIITYSPLSVGLNRLRRREGGLLDCKRLQQNLMCKNINGDVNFVGLTRLTILLCPLIIV